MGAPEHSCFIYVIKNGCLMSSCKTGVSDGYVCRKLQVVEEVSIVMPAIDRVETAIDSFCVKL
jgi:hypothetical protein